MIPTPQANRCFTATVVITTLFLVLFLMTWNLSDASCPDFLEHSGSCPEDSWCPACSILIPDLGSQGSWPGTSWFMGWSIPGPGLEHPRSWAGDSRCPAWSRKAPVQDFIGAGQGGVLLTFTFPSKAL